MKLTESEIELLRLIAEAQYLGRPITFYEDRAVIDDFNEKYGEAFWSLIDKLYIDGGIGEHCFIVLTGYGEKVLEKIRSEEKEKKNNAGNKKQNWGIILSVIGIVVSVIIYLLTR